MPKPPLCDLRVVYPTGDKHVYRNVWLRGMHDNNPNWLAVCDAHDGLVALLPLGTLIEIAYS